LSPRKVVLDTNLYIDWMNRGLREAFMIGPGFVRYLSAVVQMELRVGARTLPARRAVDQLQRAYRTAGRVVAPDAQLFDTAGRTLRALHEMGREVRRSSLVGDVLIAHTARSLGASLVTVDRDYEAIRSVLDFDLEVVST
jgi:predicted nucleic acid-binding protein